MPGGAFVYINMQRQIRTILAPLRTWVFPITTILAVMSFILEPVFCSSRNHARYVNCLQNEKRIGESLSLYISDNDGWLPPADHWMDATAGYIQKANKASYKPTADWRDLYHCRAAQQSGETNYAFDNRLSLAAEDTIEMPAERIIIFDSTKTDRNASDAGESLPMPGIHLGGDIVTYMDGHARYLSPHSMPPASEIGQPKTSWTIQESLRR